MKMAKRPRSPSFENPVHHIGKQKNNESLLTHCATSLRTLPHYIFPSFNTCNWPLEDYNDLEDYPSASFSPPRPIYVSPLLCPAIDICHKRVLAQESYARRLLVPRTRFLNVRRSHKSVRSSEENNIYHSAVFEAAERLAINPDPFFTTNYDIYYTDGNLSILPKDNFILHVTGEELKNLNLSMFPKDYDPTTANLWCTKSVNFEGDSEIFAVKPLIDLLDHSNCFAVRCLKRISIFHKVDDSLQPIAQFKNLASPFISFAQASHESNLFAVSTMKQHVRLYDLNISQHEVKSLWQLADHNESSGWNIMRPWCEHTFLYANETKLVLMDTRSKADEWNKACNILSPDYACERISTLSNSQFKNLVYIGTTHKLHCLDLRYFNTKTESVNGAICRWTHQLDYPPAFIDTYRHCNSEYIAFGSALADDLRICELKRKMKLENFNVSTYKSTIFNNHFYISTNLPYQPPTLLEAFESARSTGKCLQPNRNIRDRIMCSRTGLIFYTEDSKDEPRTVLLSSNSCGDIFAFNIDTSEARSYERSNKTSDMLMTKYAKKVSRISQPKLKYTEIVDGKPLRKILCCEALDKKTNDEDEFNRFNFKPNRFGRWQKSLGALHRFKDMLAKEILQIWDIDEEDNAQLNISSFTKETEESNINEYVKSWLDKANNSVEIVPLNKDAIDLDEKTETTNYDMIVDNLSQNISAFQNNTLEIEESTQYTSELDPLKINFTEEFYLCEIKKSPQVSLSEAKTVSKLLKTPKVKSKHIKGF